MKLLFFTPACRIGQSLLMDRAYEGDKMRTVAKKLGYNPIVPPKKNRIDPWEYDRKAYYQRSNNHQGKDILRIASSFRCCIISGKRSICFCA